MVRCAQNPLTRALPIQKLIGHLDPALGVANVLTLDQAIGQSLSSQSFEAVVITGFAIPSLLPASIGLYGVLSYVCYTENERNRNSNRAGRSTRRVNFRHSARWNQTRAIWLGVWSCRGYGRGAADARSLVGTAPTDVSVFFAASSAILLVAVLACVVPAVRASGIDPVTSLRAE